MKDISREAFSGVTGQKSIDAQLTRLDGLEALLRMDADQTRDFFELFFRLPADLQRAYLSGREDVRGTTAAMAALFRAAPWRLRAKLMNTW